MLPSDSQCDRRDSTCVPLSTSQKDALVPGGRIVKDHFRWRGHLINASQRSTDPKDEGRWRGPESYLPDVLQHIHDRALLPRSGWGLPEL